MNIVLNKLNEALGKEFISKIKAIGLPYEKINEIRITSGKPVYICAGKDRYYLDFAVSSEKIDDIFASFCEYSVHAYKKEIINGFITAEGGIRIGICGTAVNKNGKTDYIKNITSLNIRIPHEIKGSADMISCCFGKGGILVAGPPSSGKTTLLRDIARTVSEKYNTVIVDERNEIAGVFHGVAAFDTGYSGILSGFSKAEGIKSAVRSMSPDYIICDEFGDENDISSALFAMKSGVNIIASIHTADENDLMKKPMADVMLNKNIFEYIVFLDSNHCIYKILHREEIIK